MKSLERKMNCSKMTPSAYRRPLILILAFALVFSTGLTLELLDSNYSVVVFGPSMQHSDQPQLGMIDSRDSVVLEPFVVGTTLETYFDRIEDGSSSFGSYGDVVAFKTPGAQHGNLHRLIIYVQYNLDQENVTANIPELNVYNITELSLLEFGPKRMNLTINLTRLYQLTYVNDQAVEAGYITMGDNMEFPDQAIGIPLVTPADIQGVAVLVIDNELVTDSPLEMAMLLGLMLAIIIGYGSWFIQGDGKKNIDLERASKDLNQISKDLNRLSKNLNQTSKYRASKDPNRGSKALNPIPKILFGVIFAYILGSSLLLQVNSGLPIGELSMTPVVLLIFGYWVLFLPAELEKRVFRSSKSETLLAAAAPLMLLIPLFIWAQLSTVLLAYPLASIAFAGSIYHSWPEYALRDEFGNYEPSRIGTWLPLLFLPAMLLLITFMLSPPLLLQLVVGGLAGGLYLGGKWYGISKRILEQ